MPHPPKSPDSPELTFICGLGWPKMERYFLSRRYSGCWDFWVLAPGKKKARQLFARLAEAGTAEDQVAFDSLDFYLENHRKLVQPEKDVFIEGLLIEPMIQTVLEQHLERGKQKYSQLYGEMLGMMADSMDHDEFDQLIDEIAESSQPEQPAARVLPFPLQDVEDDGTVN
jgi:hypothetical protein